MRATDAHQMRRQQARTARLATLAVVIVLTLVGAGLWYAGVIDLSGLRRPTRSTAGLVAVPIPLRAIPAYTRITRDHLFDPQTQQVSVLYLPPASVTDVMLTRVGDIIGRVLDHDKGPGFVFTNADFLPRGTREGLVAGIPAGKRALRVDLEKVDGLIGLHIGDRFDLVATLPIDAGLNATRAFDVGGAFGAQLSLQARLQNWQKQATVQVLVQSGVLVEPVATRQVPVFSRTLTQGGITRMRPVQEAVIAVGPHEVAPLTEAMAVGATISTVPRSGRPDDPQDSLTPGLRPISPFTGTAATATAAPSASPAATPGAFTTVERITGSERALTAVPKR